MLKQLLLLSLLGLSQGMKIVSPMVKNLYYPYIPMHQQSIVQTYGISVSKMPLRFWDSFCLVSRRNIAAIWDVFDTDGNGLVDQSEIAAASLCNPLVRKRKAPGQTVSQYFATFEPNCKWLLGQHQPLGRYLMWYGEYDGQAFYAMYLLAGKLNDLFHISDVDNDNCLDMNEFWTFGSHLWDSAQFFLMSTRTLDEDGYPVEEDNDKISQIEWDCSQNEDETGHEPENCNPNEGQQLLLSEMPGNNMDADIYSLNLPEFKWVYSHLLMRAKNSPYWEGFCGNWKIPFLGAETSPLDSYDKKL